MHTVSAVPQRVVMARFDPGEDLLEAIQAAVNEAGIRNGAILSGVGSLTSYHFHVVSSVDLPPENAFVKGEGAFDILTVTGFVIDGRVHAHLTFSDTKIAMGGHLEPGTNILTFAMVVIADTPDTSYTGWDTVGALKR